VIDLPLFHLPPFSPVLPGAVLAAITSYQFVYNRILFLTPLLGSHVCIPYMYSSFYTV
jgi:hypothetical protein